MPFVDVHYSCRTIYPPKKGRGGAGLPLFLSVNVGSYQEDCPQVCGYPQVWGSASPYQDSYEVLSSLSSPCARVEEKYVGRDGTEGDYRVQQGQD